ASPTRRVLFGRRTSDRDQSLPARDQLRPAALPVDKGSAQNYRRRQKRAPSVRFYPLAASANAAGQPGAGSTIRSIPAEVVVARTVGEDGLSRFRSLQRIQGQQRRSCMQRCLAV